MHQKLNAFITHARGKGMDHATIRLLLLSAGWKETEIAAALAAEGLDMSVPEPPGRRRSRRLLVSALVHRPLRAGHQQHHD